MSNNDQQPEAATPADHRDTKGGNALPIETNWGEICSKFNLPETVSSFDSMDLNPDLLHGIFSYGFEEPSAIQKRGIIALKTGRHLIAQAQSGTGKTATFSIGTLDRIDLSKKQCQVLVIAPTRELANQICKVYSDIGKYLNGLSVMACVGGTSVGQDSRRLEQGVHVVVGTPGRVKHMIESGRLVLTDVKSFVLDEADEMLSRGFQEQIYEILSKLNHNFQICLFSATLEKETLEIANNFMEKAIMILLKKEQITLEGILQYKILLKDEWKCDILSDIYNRVQINQCIIYCNTKKGASMLAESMIQDDHVVSFITGDMEDLRRKKIMSEFRSGSTRVLISTDLNSRGIDVQGVSLVINFDLPKLRETYIHRIGRSGRFGRKGVAINFVDVDSDDKQMIEEIERYYSTEIKELNPKELEGDIQQ